MIDRRNFVKGLSAACVVSSGLTVLRSAHAAEFSYRIAHTTPATHPLHIRLTEAAERIKADTKGRFDLQVFPADQLGSQSDVLGQVRSGAVDFFMLSGVILSTFVPNSAISGVGFAFKDYDTVWKAMDGGLGAFIRGEIAKSKSIFAFEKIWDNGFRQITSSSRQVNAPADLQGVKIRVPPSAMWTSLFKGLGASPTTINANELYSSLQTKIVDAQENPLAVVSTFKLYEVQKYVSMTNHMWDGFLAARQSRSIRCAAQRHPGHRVQASEHRRIGAAGRPGEAQHEPARGTEQEGPAVRDAQASRVPGQAARCRLLQGVAREVPRRRLGSARSRCRRSLSIEIMKAISSLPMPVTSGPLQVAERALFRLTAVISAMLLTVIIVLLFAGVVARYVFHVPITWSDELCSIVFLWLAMLGAALATQQASHMRMTALVTMFGERWSSFFASLALATGLAFLLLVLGPAYHYASEEAFVTTSALEISNAWRASAVPGRRRADDLLQSVSVDRHHEGTSKRWLLSRWSPSRCSGSGYSVQT